MQLPPAIQSQLPLWKATYGAIFLQRIGEIDYVFRTCSKTEANYLTSGVHTLEEEALTAVLLYPFKLLLPDHFGQYQKLIKSVLDVSGYTDANIFRDRLLTSRQKYFADELEQTVIVSMICTAFPGITVDEVEKWPASKVLKYLSHSEIMLGTQLEAMLETFRKGSKSSQKRSESVRMPNTPKSRKSKPKRKKKDEVDFGMDNELLRQFLGNPNDNGEYTFHGPAR